MITFNIAVITASFRVLYYWNSQHNYYLYSTSIKSIFLNQVNLFYQTNFITVIFDIVFSRATQRSTAPIATLLNIFNRNTVWIITK